MHECCSTSSQQWQKTQLPKQSPSSTFVTGRAVKDVLAQLNTRVCGWALCLAAASASAWCYRLEFLSSRGTRDSDCLDWAFLHFKILILRLLELPSRLESPIAIHQRHPSPPKSIENSDFKFS